MLETAFGFWSDHIVAALLRFTTCGIHAVRFVSGLMQRQRERFVMFFHSPRFFVRKRASHALQRTAAGPRGCNRPAFGLYGRSLGEGGWPPSLTYIGWLGVFAPLLPI